MEATVTIIANNICLIVSNNFPLANGDRAECSKPFGIQSVFHHLFLYQIVFGDNGERNASSLNCPCDWLFGFNLSLTVFKCSLPRQEMDDHGGCTSFGKSQSKVKKKREPLNGHITGEVDTRGDNILYPASCRPAFNGISHIVPEIFCCIIAALLGDPRVKPRSVYLKNGIFREAYPIT